MRSSHHRPSLYTTQASSLNERVWTASSYAELLRVTNLTHHFAVFAGFIRYLIYTSYNNLVKIFVEQTQLEYDLSNKISNQVLQLPSHNQFQHVLTQIGTIIDRIFFENFPPSVTQNRIGQKCLFDARCYKIIYIAVQSQLQ